jgi:hypothetical protein
MPMRWFIIVLVVPSMVLAWFTSQWSKLPACHIMIRLAWVTGLWFLVLLFLTGCFLVGPLSLLVRDR